jgi:hypothetical protein
MATVTYQNTLVTSDKATNANTIPNLSSTFPSDEPTPINILKYPYPISSSIFSIIANTPLPDSALLLRHDLSVRQEITKDGYLIRSSYIDEESYGETLQQAYFDFLTSIRDKYRSLQRREAKLSPRDKTVLENIRSLLT